MQFGICCSSRTRPIADRLEARLRRNLDIETLIVEADDAPLTETWEEAAAAGAILLILDSTTAPAPFRRADWQALEQQGGTPPLAWLRVEDCAYPKVVERRQ